MERREIKFKEHIYPLTNAILSIVVRHKIIKYYNFVRKDNDKNFDPNDYLYNDELKNMESPKIIVMNHSNVHDFPIINNALNHHSIILSAKDNLRGINGFVINMNGCVPVIRNDKESRKNANEELKNILKQGKDVLVMVEGVWNLTPHIPILPFSWGIIDTAKETNAPILPVILEYEKNECYVNIGSLIDVHNFENKKDAYIYLRDMMATLRWNLWELFGTFSKDEINQEYFDKLIEHIKSEYKPMDFEEEAKLAFKDYDIYDEVWAPIKNLNKKD